MTPVRAKFLNKVGFSWSGNNCGEDDSVGKDQALSLEDDQDIMMSEPKVNSNEKSTLEENKEVLVPPTSEPNTDAAWFAKYQELKVFHQQHGVGISFLCSAASL